MVGGYLVIAPGDLTRGGSEGQGAVAAKSCMKIREIKSSGNWSSGC